MVQTDTGDSSRASGDRQNYDVFLSYSGKQGNFVRQLYRDLRNQGLSCFFDEDPECLAVGADIQSSISEACKVAVLILSKEYLEEMWSMEELSALVEARDIKRTNPDLKIIPLFLIQPGALETIEEGNEKWKKLGISEETQAKWFNASHAIGKSDDEKLGDFTEREIRNILSKHKIEMEQSKYGKKASSSTAPMPNTSQFLQALMPNTSQFLQNVPDLSRVRRYWDITPSGICVIDGDKMLKPQSIGLGLLHQKVNSVIRQAEKETALTDALREIPCHDRVKLVKEVYTQFLEPIRKFYGARPIAARWAEVFARDACYIIQFFSARRDVDYMEPELTADIFIPSNQIPLFLLVKIMNMYRNPRGKITEFVEGLARYQPFLTLCPLVVSHKDNILNNLKAEFALPISELSLHLLHLLHKSIANILAVPDVTRVIGGCTTPRSRHPTLELPTDVFKTLTEYNITFRERIGKVDFKYKWRDLASILYLPSIRLEEDRTVTFHKSLMAFDWISSDCNPICDLTFLLHLIVDDRNSKLFSKARIIRGGGERFCTNLKDIADDLKKFYIGDEGYHGGVYRSVIDQLDKHTQVVWNEWMYRARDWVILLGLLALFAAILFGVVNEIRK